MAVLFSLRKFGRTFATRGRGAELREEVIAQSSHHQVVILDFADVTNVSYSFADEFVGKLTTDHPDGPKVEVINMSGTVHDTVRSAQHRRASAIAC